jgi:hypothetical protein
MTTQSHVSTHYQYPDSRNPLQPLLDAVFNLQEQDPEELEDLAAAVFPDRTDPRSLALVDYLMVNRPPERLKALLKLVEKEVWGPPETFGLPENAEAVVSALVTVLEVLQEHGEDLP